MNNRYRYTVLHPTAISVKLRKTSVVVTNFKELIYVNIRLDVITFVGMMECVIDSGSF